MNSVSPVALNAKLNAHLTMKSAGYCYFAPLINEAGEIYAYSLKSTEGAIMLEEIYLDDLERLQDNLAEQGFQAFHIQ